MKKLHWFPAIMIVMVLLSGLMGHALAQSQETVRVLITFRERPGPVAERLVESLGGSPRYNFHIVPAMSATVPKAEVDRIRASAGVVSVEEDSGIHIAEQTLTWGVDRIDAEVVHGYNKGTGVKVAILDTGIDLDNPDLHVAGAVTFVAGTSSGDDDSGHGTHVAGTVAALDNGIGAVGVAPEAVLYAVKVVDSNGQGFESDLIKGIEWAVDNGMQVINMSLSSHSATSALEQACNAAYQAGIVLVCAAGNGGNPSGIGDTVGYPARYDSVIAVASTDCSNTRASDSSTGPAVELAAPGVNICSTCLGGTCCLRSGTSMASAHVAGVAALVIASGIADGNGDGRINDEVRQRLQTTADDLGPPGRDTFYGYGLVDASEAVPLTAPATSPWAGNTGLDVSAGQTLGITATGIWASGSWTGGANGDQSNPTPGGDYIMPNANAYSLIGKIGDTGAPFFIGTAYSSQLNATGRLYLSMNDSPDSFGDNSGSLTVVISLENPTSCSSAPCAAAGGGESGGCFIATAAYGSYLDSHVQTLRNFRDSYMVTNPVGRSLVLTYYRLSPPIAEFIDDHPSLKPIVRVGLLPAVAMSTVAVSTTLAEKMAIVGVFALVSVALAVRLRRKAV